MCLWFFLTRSPCRIVTTSAKDDHLRVLWGEILRYIQTSKVPLDHRKGGPLVINHHDIRRVSNGERCPLSYMVGMVAGPDSIASMQGHHIASGGDRVPRTLFVADEASSVNDEYWRMAITWANRCLVIGNPWQCSNFFYRAVKGTPGTDDHGGDLPRPNGRPGLTRKVVQIGAEDSPNVLYARAQEARGETPDDTILVEGVKSWERYQTDLQTMDRVQQCVSLGGRFYEGSESLLFPPEWLTAGEDYARTLRASGRIRRAKAIGCDPAEGGDKSAWVVGDELGIIEVLSMKTPDTNDVVKHTLALMFKHNVPPDHILFDRGGGGKQHADRLRSMGHNVRTVGFGETLTPDPKRATYTAHSQRIDDKEGRYAYVSRRAEMYDLLSRKLDPSLNPTGYALYPWLPDLRRQLAPVPRQYDHAGRMKLPPKSKPASGAGSKTVCLIDLIGHSPDESDALVLMLFGIMRPAPRTVAGVV